MYATVMMPKIAPGISFEHAVLREPGPFADLSLFDRDACEPFSGS